MLKKYFCLAMVSLMFILSSFLPPSFFVYAETIEQDILGIDDFYLYNELLFLANEGRAEPLLKLETDALISVDEINISNNQIQSLEGLQLLNLASIKKVNFSGNQLSIITSEQLSTLSSLEELDLSNNNITQCELGNLSNINTLNLSRNNLSQINISKIVHNLLLGNGYVNLNNNNFTSLADIILPSELTNAIVVDLCNNYLTSQNISVVTATHTLDLMFQGVKEGETLTEGQLLSVYYTEQFTDFNVKIYDDTLTTLLYEVYEGEQAELVANNYKLKYYEGEVELYNEILTEPYEFTPISYTVKPQMPTMQILKDNEVVENLPAYNTAITIEFADYNENATIYYSINNGSWIEGNSIDLENNGRYSISAKAIYNGVASSSYLVTLEINIAWQAAWSIFKGIASLILLIVLFGFGFYYKSKKTT